MSAVARAGNPPPPGGHKQAVEVDDSVLWSRARAGDSEAFGLLFERHARTIYNYCFRRVGSWALAEDLVSIVFLEASRRVDKQLPSGKELPWLFWDRNQRRPQPSPRRATPRCGAQARSPAESRADLRGRQRPACRRRGVDGARPRARCPTPPSRAGGLCALRLVRAQLRRRGDRARDPGRNGALSPLPCTCSLAGTRSRHRT
jgi:sigma-70-like protein